MDQPAVESIVRLTARLSAAMFAAALLVFATGYPHAPRRLHLGTRLFADFIAAHTIHFATVAWLAAVTAGANIRERDGWAVVLTVAVLFFAAAFLVVRAWSAVAKGQPARRLFLPANLAVGAIAAAFLNSYVARVGLMPIYWLPIVGVIGPASATHRRLARSVSASSRWQQIPSALQWRAGS